MSAYGEVGFVKNVYTKVIHADTCSRKPVGGAHWHTVPRRPTDWACSFCLPDGLPPVPAHQIRSILPTIWVCSCNGFNAWDSEAEAKAHFTGEATS